MSHEIRTPMNAIIGMTNMVRKKLGETPVNLDNIKSNMRQIDVSSQHLLGLLNDILDITKIESGKIEAASDKVDIAKLADAVATIIRPRCEEKNIVFETSFDLSPPGLFLTDSLLLKQALLNILGNAAKFTLECGRVEFRVREAGRADGRTLLEFSVRDTGIGISDEAMETLFQPFEQGGSHISRRYGGVGLGLTLSKKIVNLLGGDIEVESEVGSGSTFRFSLWIEEAIPEERTENSSGDATNRFSGRRALIVDDVEINRIIAIDLLDETGISIDEAEDGLEAVKMFEKSPENTYDIIFMDVQMPNMDGNEASSAIRAMNRADARTVPIVALTANAFKDDMEKSARHGMNAHLAKPIEPEKLLEVTNKFLGRGK
jgi:CheY-like chemotaxis protein